MATSSTCPCSSCTWSSRYTGAAPESAPLHKLGTDQWAKARKRAADQIRDVAAELLDLYAQRQAQRGPSLPASEQEYQAFASSFPFEETADQAEAIRQVLRDLESEKPMDRVVCGDVGFGKTEVAMRAAFVAAQAGKQVAVLVPTTLLAQQHTANFRDRFADWPVRIESLSRFRTGKESNAVLEGIEKGTVDIVIATHRLLHANVRFKDLGLIIVDEEHRFGVRDKERLKTLRAEVHVLTLTATPIPRTLNMALGGLRDLSLITTPPAERLAIKTFVTEWHAPTLREAALREFRRGGQMYFVHNEVETIEKTAQEIAKLIPEADVRVGHGQMRERDLEQLMVDFYHRRFNLLVCTTIIESGIDVPTANTIMINRADRLGLAQLHQLRGRVGRSHHRAYAYLLDAAAQGADRRCRQAPRGHRVAGGAGRGLRAGHARPRDPRRRRVARRVAERPDDGDRPDDVSRPARAGREGAQGRPRAGARPAAGGHRRSGAATAGAASRELRRATCTCAWRCTSASRPRPTMPPSTSSPRRSSTASGRCRRRPRTCCASQGSNWPRAQSESADSTWVRRAAMPCSRNRTRWTRRRSYGWCSTPIVITGSRARSKLRISVETEDDAERFEFAEKFLAELRGVAGRRARSRRVPTAAQALMKLDRLYFRPMKLPAVLALALTGCPRLAAGAARRRRRRQTVYTIEIIVFRNCSGAGGPEDWGAKAVAARPGDSRVARDRPLRAVDSRLAVPAQRRRREAANTTNYPPIAHFAWQQTASSWGSRAGFTIAEAGRQCAGTVGHHLSRARQLPAPRACRSTTRRRIRRPASAAAPGTVFNLSESRRVKFDQLQLLRSPGVRCDRAGDAGEPVNGRTIDF